MFQKLFATILNAVFPADAHEIDCATLDEKNIVARYSFLCVDSKHHIYACASYHNEIISSLIRQLKFKRRRIAAHFLALLAQRPLENEVVFARTEPWLIVPIPLSKRRLRQRGFNQASLIAEILARSTMRATMCPATVINRIYDTRPQSELARIDRFANVRGVFKANIENLQSVRARPLLLLDDVTTTGATMAEARRTLVSAGARDVVCLAIAH